MRDMTQSCTVLEDDIEIAPDFFNYMVAGAALVAKDPTLWTVTAWNDNGLPLFAKDPKKLYRSDFFGGWVFVCVGVCVCVRACVRV